MCYPDLRTRIWHGYEPKYKTRLNYKKHHIFQCWEFDKATRILQFIKSPNDINKQYKTKQLFKEEAIFRGIKLQLYKKNLEFYIHKEGRSLCPTLPHPKSSNLANKLIFSSITHFKNSQVQKGSALTSSDFKIPLTMTLEPMHSLLKQLVRQWRNLKQPCSIEWSIHKSETISF